jgi:hypothetical protein
MQEILEHLLERQVSPQWRGFLEALAGEFSDQLDQDELRQLMARVGMRFAAAHPLGPCESTDDLANALNARWREMEWATPSCPTNRHFCASFITRRRCAPLGAGHLGWSAAFLQGAYQGWFDSVGAAGLRVTQDVVPQDDARIELRIARAPH